MKLKKYVTFLCIFSLLGLAVCFSAQAATINSVLDVPGENQFEDTDVERVLRFNASTGEFDTIINGPVQVGDIFESILRFTTVNADIISDLSIGGELPLPYTLAAYSQIQVIQVADLGGGLVDLAFGPTGALSDPNAMVDLYEGNSLFYNQQTADPATAIAQITSQPLVTSFGISEGDDFWVSTGPADYSVVANLSSGDPQAPAGVFGLTALLNPGNLPILPNGIESGFAGTFHDVVGNVSVYQKSDDIHAGWTFASNTTANFNTIPEPSTMLLLGFGLLGIAGATRKKIKK